MSYMHTETGTRLDCDLISVILNLSGILLAVHIDLSLANADVCDILNHIISDAESLS